MSFIAIKKELAGWAKIKKMLEDNYEDLDPAALLDTLEGETNLKEAIAASFMEVQEMEMQLEGIRGHIKTMTARKQRVEATIETFKNTMLTAMERAGLDSVPTDLGAISVAKTPRGANITDEAALPAKYWKQPDPVLDKKALLADLRANAEEEVPPEIPGAHLTNGGIRLNIRMK